MDYKDWLAIKVLGEELNLSRAAEKLYTSQPALSHRLHKIENDLNIKIFLRYSHGITLTAQGLYLKEYATRMLEELAIVKTHLQGMDNSPSGNLKIGFSSIVAKYKMVKLIKNYKTISPNVHVDIKVASSTLKLPQLLEKGLIDMAIVRGNKTLPYLEFILQEEPMYILFHKPFQLQELAQHPFIEYESAQITGSRQIKSDWWHKTFSQPFPNIIQVDSIDSCIQMVLCSMGWCIVPKIHLQNYRSLFTLPVIFPDGTPLTWKTRLLVPNTAMQNPICRDFIHYICKKYS